eukprot:6586980-Lingulodinium_polyedra.AAC.1
MSGYASSQSSTAYSEWQDVARVLSGAVEEFEDRRSSWHSPVSGGSDEEAGCIQAPEGNQNEEEQEGGAQDRQ